MGIAYVKTTQARQFHCPCSFSRGSHQRLAGERGLPLTAASGWSPWSLPAPLTHPTISLPQSQGTSAELHPAVTFLSPSNRIFILFWVSCLSCPLCFCSETCCFFKALQQQAFDNLLVLSQVHVKAQQWSCISYSGCETDFSFQRCGWFAIFPKLMYDLHRIALQKRKSCVTVQFTSQTVSQTIGSTHCVICKPVGYTKNGGNK